MELASACSAPEQSTEVSGEMMYPKVQELSSSVKIRLLRVSLTKVPFKDLLQRATKALAEVTHPREFATYLVMVATMKVNIQIIKGTAMVCLSIRMVTGTMDLGLTINVSEEAKLTSKMAGHITDSLLPTA